MLIEPLSGFSMPNKSSAISVRPEPRRPARAHDLTGVEFQVERLHGTGTAKPARLQQGLTA